MDILYYSNYCKHSQNIIQFLTKSDLIKELNAFCIDKRFRDPKTNQIMIQLENGKAVLLPPNIQSVPALLCVSQNYKLILGDDIIKYFEPAMKEKLSSASFGEPAAFALGQMSGSGGSNIVSEQYTDFNMSPEELSAKGIGGRRQMHNYVMASDDNSFIQTPPDDYRADKIGDVSLDTLQQQRNSDISTGHQKPQFEYQTMDI
jgi:hypothetical protein